jgi:predicted  nucleic acid-binding Zn-ribbon protein
VADHHRWLEVLQGATNYRELQSVFSQMAADANAVNNATDLVDSIDEAIRRIEQERSRDSSELEKFATEYDSFKQEQSGVIGWFKRKLPFTETRKQELQHRGAVNKQKAEILADNFVIARAQMLKERILPSALRRMGNRPNDWRDRLLQHESIQEIRHYSMVAMDLGNQLIQSKGFVEKVRIEIEAFSDADFEDKDERSMRDADLLTARAELKSLEDETREKETLRKTALKRIATLIQNELVTNDPSFQTISLRSDQLKEIVDEISKATKLIDERRTTLASLVEKLSETERVPEQREALENAVRKLHRELEDAEHRRSHAATDLIQPTNAYNSAAREASQAKASLDSAKSKRDITVSQQNTAEVTEEFEYGATSQVEAEYERQTVIANQANEELRRAQAPFENAKRQLEKATQETDAIRKKLAQHTKDLDAIDEKQNQLRKLIGSIHDTVQRTNPDFHQAVQRYSSLLSRVTWLENQRSLVGVPKEVIYENANRDILPTSPSWAPSPEFPGKSRELTEFQQQSAAAELFSKTIKSDNDVLQKAYSQLTAARKDALKQRCHLLVDGILANEIDFD